MFSNRLAWLFLLFVLTGCTYLSAADPPSNGEPLALYRLEEPLVFDGIPDEGFWDNIPPMDFVQQIPRFGEQPTEKTVVRLTYNAEFLFIGASLYYSEPDKIMATTKKRDAIAGNTDWFGLVIDSYNDKENALAFYTNPAGIRFDASVFNDAIGELPINLSWNAFWDVKTVTNEEGWFVEMRIPFTTLAFQETNGEVVMGIIGNRFIAHKNESITAPGIPPNWGRFSSWKPSMAREVVLRGVKRKRPVYITPYLLAGRSSTQVLDEHHSAYLKENDWRLEPGVDIKYGLTDNLTLDLSVNTDFAQVEADDQQVNLTRFNLFFPEKRLFFQERAGVFNFNFGRSDNLFYSRRIGIQDGEPVRILGGARLVGRIGSWDMGFINMQTAATPDFHSENFGVLRLRRNVFNVNSYAGVLITNKIDTKGNYSSVYGLDGNFKVSKEVFISLRFAQSFQNNSPNRVFSLDPTKLWISSSTRNNDGFNYGISFSRAGKDFDPSLGFQIRDNYTRLGHRLGYGIEMGKASKVLRHGPRARGVFYWTNEYRAFDAYNGSVGWEITMKDGSTAQLSLGINSEQLFEVFDIPLSETIFVPQGRYEYYQVQGEFLTPPSHPLYVMGEFRLGQYYDGTLSSVTLSPTYNVSSFLELGGTYQYNRVEFPERGQSITAHISRLKVLLMFSTKLSVSSFIQYNSTDAKFVSNFRLRYNPREGNDLFLVYNDDINNHRGRETPFLPFSNDRTLILKYTYTFRL